MSDAYLAIANAMPRPIVERSGRLAERVKLEARWLLVGDATIVEENDDARRHFVSIWPLIRNRRLPAHDVAANFYDIAADQGALLAGLILTRRARYAR